MACGIEYACGSNVEYLHSEDTTIFNITLGGLGLSRTVFQRDPLCIVSEEQASKRGLSGNPFRISLDLGDKIFILFLYHTSNVMKN